MSASTQTNGAPATVKIGEKPAALLDSACARMKSAGLRATRPRRAILAALIGRNGPASIEQIHREAGRCDRVTVYRCVAAFEEIDLVRRAFSLDGASFYKINLGAPARYHVVCRRTRRVEEIDPAAAAELGRALQAVEERLRALGFSEVGHVAEFFGTLPADKGPPPVIAAPEAGGASRPPA